MFKRSSLLFRQFGNLAHIRDFYSLKGLHFSPLRIKNVRLENFTGSDLLAELIVASKF